MRVKHTLLDKVIRSTSVFFISKVRNTPKSFYSFETQFLFVFFFRFFLIQKHHFVCLRRPENEANRNVQRHAHTYTNVKCVDGVVVSFGFSNDVILRRLPRLCVRIKRKNCLSGKYRHKRLSFVWKIVENSNNVFSYAFWLITKRTRRVRMLTLVFDGWNDSTTLCFQFVSHHSMSTNSVIYALFDFVAIYDNYVNSVDFETAN